MMYLSFCAWLIPLSIMSSRFIDVAALWQDFNLSYDWMVFHYVGVFHYVYTYTHTQTCIYTHICIYMLCTYIQTYIYMLHTHRHTQTYITFFGPFIVRWVFRLTLLAIINSTAINMSIQTSLWRYSFLCFGYITSD